MGVWNFSLKLIEWFLNSIYCQIYIFSFLTTFAFMMMLKLVCNLLSDRKHAEQNHLGYHNSLFTESPQIFKQKHKLRNVTL